MQKVDVVYNLKSKRLQLGKIISMTESGTIIYLENCKERGNGSCLDLLENQEVLEEDIELYHQGGLVIDIENKKLIHGIDEERNVIYLNSILPDEEFLEDI